MTILVSSTPLFGDGKEPAPYVRWLIDCSEHGTVLVPRSWSRGGWLPVYEDAEDLHGRRYQRLVGYGSVARRRIAVEAAHKHNCDEHGQEAEVRVVGTTA